jgi:flagellar hook assembly protein FlgD
MNSQRCNRILIGMVLAVLAILPIGKEVNIAIYDPLGRRVRTLCDGFRNQGTYALTWDGRGNAGERLTAGVYFLRFEAGEYSHTARLLLVPNDR